MAEKSIIIIGAGMGGLAAGVYGQMNGYRTQIFEMHTVAGGEAATWKRKGYTFDGCIHHLFGCSPRSKLHGFWTELGAMPRALAPTRECVSALSPEGKVFNDYWDPDRLEAHLKALAPADAKLIDEYIRGIRLFAAHDLWGEMVLGGLGDKLKVLPALLPMLKYFKPTLQQIGDRFTDPFLKRAFPLLGYSLPDMPYMVHLVRHGSGLQGDIAWPVGGSAGLARSIAQRYRDLGGEVHYGQRVDRILVENDRAVGVRLGDGSEHRADIVISNADGRKTILNMLEGHYTDARIRGYCGDLPDETSWGVLVFLGVNRDLAAEPSAQVMLLDEPATIANHRHTSLEMQTYGFDPTMAPAGKGVIKVDLPSSYAYWKALYADRSRYEEEKQKAAEAVIEVLEPRFPGLKRQVEVVDVATLMTWERYMGGSHGWATGPTKKPSVIASAFGRGLETTLPGLDGFYFVGSWATSAGALFPNALSGKTVVKAICRQDGKRFANGG